VCDWPPISRVTTVAGAEASPFDNYVKRYCTAANKPVSRSRVSMRCICVAALRLR
jgi:hypothetical protein